MPSPLDSPLNAVYESEADYTYSPPNDYTTGSSSISDTSHYTPKILSEGKFLLLKDFKPQADGKTTNIYVTLPEYIFTEEDGTPATFFTDNFVFHTSKSQLLDTANSENQETVETSPECSTDTQEQEDNGTDCVIQTTAVDSESESDISSIGSQAESLDFEEIFGVITENELI